MATESPLIVITGPTASGKTGLAIKLAERWGGEIVCADSRTIYKGMDIGTAKPTAADQARVPHHLLDVAEPSQSFTLADFQTQARAAIDDIRCRGKVPFLVGGTGLYIDSIILDYQLSGPPNEQLRQRLSAMDIDQLQQLIVHKKFTMPENPLNKRQLVRVIEQAGVNTKRRRYPEKNTIVVAITTDKSTLDVRIRQRAMAMFEAGVLREARLLGDKYGWDSEAMTGNIYPILRQVIDRELTEQEAIERFVIRDRQLVKRQLTWLRRHDFVVWKTLEDAEKYLESILGRRNNYGSVLG